MQPLDILRWSCCKNSIRCQRYRITRRVWGAIVAFSSLELGLDRGEIFDHIVQTRKEDEGRVRICMFGRKGKTGEMGDFGRGFLQPLVVPLRGDYASLVGFQRMPHSSRGSVPINQRVYQGKQSKGDLQKRFRASVDGIHRSCWRVLRPVRNQAPLPRTASAYGPAHHVSLTLSRRSLRPTPQLGGQQALVVLVRHCSCRISRRTEVRGTCEKLEPESLDEKD